MAQFILRNLEEDVESRLAQRARAHGCSTEDEVREILPAAALTDLPAESRGSQGLGSRIAARFAGLGLRDDIAPWQGESARPADLC